MSCILHLIWDLGLERTNGKLDLQLFEKNGVGKHSIPPFHRVKKALDTNLGLRSNLFCFWEILHLINVDKRMEGGKPEGYLWEFLPCRTVEMWCAPMGGGAGLGSFLPGTSDCYSLPPRGSLQIQFIIVHTQVTCPHFCVCPPPPPPQMKVRILIPLLCPLGI